jgi:hypothetical protein
VGFVKGRRYSRREICVELGVKSDKDQHAVLVNKGTAVAIVVNENGVHPSAEKYANHLGPREFSMEGENDRRGQLLEQSGAPLPLFYRHKEEVEYAYEGEVRFRRRMPATGRPIREFDRC